EITGKTLEQDQAAVTKQLDDALAGINANQQADQRSMSDPDRAIDQYMAGLSTIKDKTDALTGAAGAANDVMTKIKTPGTDEYKRFEAVLAAMESAQAYERQKQRLEQAKKDVAEKEAALP